MGGEEARIEFLGWWRNKGICVCGLATGHPASASCTMAVIFQCGLGAKRQPWRRLMLRGTAGIAQAPAAAWRIEIQSLLIYDRVSVSALQLGRRCLL